MSFQVPVPNPLSLEATRADSSVQARLRISDQGRPVLAIGSVVDVLVSSGKDGQLGVIIQGNFYAAHLPRGLQPGDKFRAQVESNLDALVLKLFTDASDQDETLLKTLGKHLPAESALGEALKKLLSQTDITKLKTLSNILSPQPPQQTPKELKVLPSGVEQLLSSLTAVETLQDAAEDLRKIGVLLTQRNLTEPEQVETTLKRLLQGSLSTPLQQLHREATRSLDERPIPQGLVVGIAVEKVLRALLASEVDLGFEVLPQPAASKDIAALLSSTLALSHYAVTLRDSDLLSRLQEYTKQPQLLKGPLLLLLQNLSSLNLGGDESQALEGSGQEINKILKEIVSVLSALRDEQANHQKVRVRLQTLLAEVTPKFDQVREQIRDLTLGSHSQRSAQSLETLLQGQEVLNRLNPVAQLFGEPMVAFLPFLHGLHLQRWEARFGTSGSPDEGTSEEGDRQLYQRVEMLVDFSTLGKVHIDLAHRNKEVLLRLGVEADTTRIFIEKQLKKLRDSLGSLGYQRMDFHVAEGVPQSISPTWYHELTKARAVA